MVRRAAPSSSSSAAAGTVWTGRAAFDGWQALRNRNMRTADARRLSQLINKAAALSPVFRAMLDWAVRNDVKIFVDHAPAGYFHGYYTGGTGAAAASARAFSQGLAHVAGVIAHEIRHAWQDKKKLFAKYTDITTALVTTGLIEADATAVQKTVSEQVADGLKAGARAARWTRDKTQQRMWTHFQEWFAASGQSYGQRLLTWFAWRYDLGPKPEAATFEFRTASQALGAVDYHNDAEVRRYGRVPGGYDYMDAYNVKRVLATARSDDFARTLFNAAAKPPPLMRKVLRYETITKTWGVR